ncbi:hypothetical protein FIV50_02450 [Microbacterium foliorum]|uniref:Uncharacterized protein n=1 Tax=Microbacterium foliorum TaxID=104336 RepID=A0A4Y5YMI1_9MICO|nr:DUF6492 family protein [Microbacterium foliorum]QDE33756.1 hypothetical protein FIV50_02450 [Microbacterium foliorum]
MTDGQTKGLTFVTVTFRAEDALLRLQARSMARFLDASVVETIIVIDNGSPGLGTRARRSLLSEYGVLAPRVRIGRAEELTHLPFASGWTLQQVLKISVSTTVETPWYVLLDAKNHFVRSVARSDFVAPDGRARGGFHSYAAHPLLPRLRTTLAYLGLSESLADRFPPTSTPFVMNTEVAQSVIADVADRSGRPFAEEFVKQNLSEFFLYSGWVARRSGGWSEMLDGEAIQSPTVWGGAADGAGVGAALAEVTRWEAPLFAVHRRAMGRLDASGTAMLADFWTGRELFADEREVRRFLRTAKRDRVLDAVRSRVRRTVGS